MIGSDGFSLEEAGHRTGGASVAIWRSKKASRWLDQSQEGYINLYNLTFLKGETQGLPVKDC